MSTCRSTAAVSVASSNAAPLPDPLAEVDPADLARFVRDLAEAAASWHRRQAPLVPCCPADRAELPRAA